MEHLHLPGELSVELLSYIHIDQWPIMIGLLIMKDDLRLSDIDRVFRQFSPQCKALRMWDLHLMMDLGIALMDPWLRRHGGRKTICSQWYHPGLGFINEHGERHGPYKLWDINGKLCEEEEWCNGNRHGPYKRWYDNGQLECEEEYRDGKKHGPWKKWHKNGQLWREEEWRDGKRHGLWKWYNNGKLWREEEWRDDKRHGMWKLWHDNGQLEKEGEWRDDKQHGTWKKWHDNGQLKYRNCKKTWVPM